MNKTKNSRLPGPDTISRIKLSNGITVLIYSNLYSKSLTVSGMVTGGSVFDQPGKEGTAHFTSSMLSRGNAKYNFTEINSMLESVGARLSFSSSSKNTWFRGRSLVKDFPMLLSLIRENLETPSFSEDYIKRLRNQLLTGLLIRDQDTGEKAALEFNKELFQDHTYAIPVDGYTQSIEKINRSDLLKHFKNITPKNGIISIAGALPKEEIEEIVRKAFEDWLPEAIDLPELSTQFKTPSKEKYSHFPIEGKSQSDIVMGTFGPSRNSEEYYAAFLGNHVLGQFGLYGRIGKSVRSREGLAYYAYSSLHARDDVGTWEFSAGVNPQNIEKTINLIKQEIARFTSKAVENEELDDSQSHLIGRLPMSLESNAGIATAMLSIERFNLGFDYFQTYADRIRSITPQQILEASRSYLNPEKLIMISTGARK